MNHDYKEIYVVDVGGDVAKRFQALSVEHQTTDVLQHVVVKRTACPYIKGNILRKNIKNCKELCFVEIGGSFHRTPPSRCS